MSPGAVRVEHVAARVAVQNGLGGAPCLLKCPFIIKSYIINSFFTVEVQVPMGTFNKEKVLVNTRLIGAGVVVGAGLVGFAGVFEREDAFFAVLGGARGIEVECFNVLILICLVSELGGSFLYFRFK